MYSYAAVNVQKIYRYICVPHWNKYQIMFRQNQQDMIELTISERIMKAILEIIIELLEFPTIDIEETLKNIVGDEKAG